MVAPRRSKYAMRSLTNGRWNGPSAMMPLLCADASCGNNNPDPVTLGAVTGGVAHYTYSLNAGSAFTATLVYMLLAAGNYTISVKRYQRLCFPMLSGGCITLLELAGATAVAVTC